MKMLQSFNEQHNIDTAIKKTYENTRFPNGFQHFVDAMIIDHLFDMNHHRQILSEGYCWNDSVRQGGIRFETTKHPMLNRNQHNAGTVTVVGSKDALELFERLLELHQVEYDGVSHPEHVKVKIEYHDELNPKIWEDRDGEYVLRGDVQDALEEAAAAFYEFLELPDLPIEDVTLTGSSANYNWTDVSDLDLHLVVDMQEVENVYGVLASNYFNAQKKVWNDLHDIKVKGLPIEFYIQDKDEKHHSTGIYSLKDEEWVVEPKHEEPEIDDNAISAKAKELMQYIREVTSSCNKADVLEQLMKKLRNMRQSGLEEAGEFSTENLVFKVLRAEGYLDLIADCKTKAFDRELSIEEEQWSILQ